MAGLKISTRWRANLARFNLRISSSVLPENIDPQTTSILPYGRRDRGLTEAMIACLFDKFFKKRIKFRDFVCQNQEVTLNL